MFVGVAIVALAAAWIGWQRGIARQRASLIREIGIRGGWYYTMAELQSREVPEPVSRVRQLFGDQSISTIYLPPPAFGPGDHAHVKAAFPEAYVWPKPG